MTDTSKEVSRVIQKFHASTIVVLDGQLTGITVGDIMSLLTDIGSLELNLQRSLKLTEEIGDLAICKVEGVAASLRRIVGYPTGPYPDLERK